MGHTNGKRLSWRVEQERKDGTRRREVGKGGGKAGKEGAPLLDNACLEARKG